MKPPFWPAKFWPTGFWPANSWGGDPRPVLIPAVHLGWRSTTVRLGPDPAMGRTDRVSSER